MAMPMATVTMLPEDCISHIFSFTSPRDVSTLSLVCRTFKSVADGDILWEKFLSSDYRRIISNSDPESSSYLFSLSKKKLYLHLCYAPILIADGTMSFGLDKQNGKKCYMMGAKALSIAWGDTHWRWNSEPTSRFSHVAELVNIWWLDVKAKVETNVLSPRTTYTAYLVYRITRTRKNEFRRRPVEVCVNLEGSNNEKIRSVILQPLNTIRVAQVMRYREDGWMEIEMGNFYNEVGDDGVLVCSLREIDGWIKCNLMIEGVELRPKDDR